MPLFSKKVTFTLVLLIIEVTVASKLNFESWVITFTYLLGFALIFVMMLSQELEDRIIKKQDK